MNELTTIIRQIESTSGTKAKQSIIEENKDNEEFYDYVYYLLNPHYNYYVTAKTIKTANKSNYTDPYTMHSFKEWCEYLNSLSSMNNNVLHSFSHWLNDIEDEEDRSIIIGLFTKSIKLGASATTFNKVISGWVPTWDVQQAFSYDNVEVPKNEEFWLTQKLNGVRATFYKGKFYSRSGSEYKGLQHLLPELDAISKLEHGFVIDGELTLNRVGEYENISDNEAFRISTGIINSDAESKENIKYTIFDIIPLSDFDSDSPAMTYSSRRGMLDYIRGWLYNSTHIEVIPILYHGTDQNAIAPLLDQMVAEDKEGLMLNRNVPYYKKRHNGILKIKRFYTMDLPIIDMEEGEGRNTGTLGAFIVDFKGNKVKVGSGFTDSQRAEFWENKDNYIGKLCEIKYKEVSYNKTTNAQSLQFPVFVQIRLDKTTVSYD